MYYCVADPPLLSSYVTVWAGSLQYVLLDMMSFSLDQLLSTDDLIFSYKDLDKLLDPQLLAECGLKICKQKGHEFFKHVFGAWTSALQSLPPDEANSFETPFGKTLLSKCIVLLQALDKTEDIVRGLIRAEHPNADYCDFWWPIAINTFQEFLHETCASATVELVRHKLLPQTVEQTFRFPSEAVKEDLWKLMREKCPCRGFLQFGGLPDGLGADLMMALIDKGLPEWCWRSCFGPFNDNLMQHVLEPAAVIRYYHDKEGAEGRLCIFLAERLSLEELCHQNQERRNALFYAEEFVEGAGGRHPDGLWIQVRDVIRQQMEAKVREFQGSLHELVELTRSVREGLGGNLVLLELIFRWFLDHFRYSCEDKRCWSFGASFIPDPNHHKSPWDSQMLR